MEECECEYCKHKNEFTFPRELLERISQGNVVVFAGAGISTENPTHCNTTFYQEIRAELNEKRELDFPLLMDLYCARPDGRILPKRVRSQIERLAKRLGSKLIPEHMPYV